MESSCHKVLIDKSMTASGILELNLTVPRNIKMKWIHLIRDGRANTYSYIRKSHIGINVKKAAKRWKRLNHRIEEALTRVSKEKICRIRYEDLCRNPEETIQKLCNFIGIRYVPGMLQVHNFSQHSIGGNPRRFQYKNEIQLDKSWKTGLTKADLRIFEKIGGTLNRRYGYQ